MTDEKIGDKKVSRRQFVGSIAAGAAAMGAVAGAAKMGLPSAAALPKVAQPMPGVPSEWNFKADVVVVGHGFAGQVSAITAAENGASVLLLEKAPMKYQGGNSRVCGQGIWSPSAAAIDGGIQYLTAMTSGTGYPVPPEYISAYVNGSHDNTAWFQAHGVPASGWVADRAPGTWEPFYPIFPGAAVMAAETDSYSVSFGKYVGSGRDWYFLEDLIQTFPNITEMYDIPATSLIQNPMTKEILGVVASYNGEPVNICANKAVIMCSGGYEFNPAMVNKYIHIQGLLGGGTPYNTGDGIKMGQAVGADLIGMGVYAAPWSNRIIMPSASVTNLDSSVPQYQGAIGFSTPSKGGVIWVGADWKRYRNEFYVPYYGTFGTPTSQFPFLAPSWAPTLVGSVYENGTFRREKTPFPLHAVFDSTANSSGKLFSASWASQIEGFTCSSDNSVELGLGWYVTAPTIKDLAAKMGTDLLGYPCNPTVLGAEVTNWNAMCAASPPVDTEFGRTVNLTPIVNPPFYAVSLVPGPLNTQGGLLRDTNCAVLDTTGTPIPRLFAAGENGDRVWANLYECMHNVGAGCMACGRVAGGNAAALTPWTSYGS